MTGMAACWMLTLVHVEHPEGSVSLVHFQFSCTIPVSQEMFHKYLLNELIKFDKITVPSQLPAWA